MALTPFGTTGGVFDPFSSLMGPAFDPFSRRGGFGGGLGGGLDLSDLMGRGFGGDVLAPFGAVGGGAQWPMDVMEFPDRFEIRAGEPQYCLCMLKWPGCEPEGADGSCQLAAVGYRARRLHFHQI